MAEYIIVNPYASDEERAAVVTINKQGGPEKANADVRFTAFLVVIAFVAWMCVTDLLTTLIFGATAIGGIWVRTAIHKPLQHLRVRNQVTTTDERLVELDGQWRAYVGAMPDKIDAQGEDYQRFNTLRRLVELAPNERPPEIDAAKKALAARTSRSGSD